MEVVLTQNNLNLTRLPVTLAVSWDLSQLDLFTVFMFAVNIASVPVL